MYPYVYTARLLKLLTLVLLIPIISYQLLYQHIQATPPPLLLSIPVYLAPSDHQPETVSVLNQFSIALIVRPFSILTTV